MAGTIVLTSGNAVATSSITLTERGAVKDAADHSAGVAYSLSPTSTPLGIVYMVLYGDGSTPQDPTVSGGGSGIVWTKVARSQPYTSVRNWWIYRGVGTFDGSAVSVTWAQAMAACSANFIDVIGVKSAGPERQGEGQSFPNATSQTQRVQRMADPLNKRLYVNWHGDSDTTTADEGTVLNNIAVLSTEGNAAVNTVAVETDDDLSDFNLGWSWSAGSRSNGNLTIELVDTNSTLAGSSVVRETLRSAGDGSGTTGGPSASYSPQAGDVIVVGFVSQRVSSSADPTSVADSLGNNYSKVAAVNIDADHRVHLWAFRYATAPGSVTMTITFAATQNGYAWYIVALRGTSGSTNTDWAASNQTGVSSGAVTSYDAPTLGALGASRGVLGVFGTNTKPTPTDVNPKAGFSRISANSDGSESTAGTGQASGGSSTMTVQMVWAAVPDDPAPGVLVGAAATVAGIAVEVA